MLIVVLDDDDDLVVGKSKPVTNNASSCNASNSNSHQRPRTNHSQHSPRNGTTHHRNSPSRSSKRREYSNKPKNQRDQRQMQTNTRTQQRPMIDTQKLSQRLNNIKQEQNRHGSRAGSPRYDRASADTSSSVTSSMHSSYSDSTTEKPHAVIAKPVERKRKKRRPRPDPEGAAFDPIDMDELDKLIYSDEPIFSDYGSEEERETPNTPRQRRPGFSIAAFAIGLGLNSNTMIKYTIISTELQNIIRVSLKMVIKSYFLY